MDLNAVQERWQPRSVNMDLPFGTIEDLTQTSRREGACRGASVRYDPGFVVSSSLARDKADEPPSSLGRSVYIVPRLTRNFSAISSMVFASGLP